MPIYKMNGSKYGKQKYRVRINYQDSFGNNRQIDRIAYGAAEAKELERELNYKLKEATPDASLTVGALYDEYIKSKRSKVRESSLHKTMGILNNHILPSLSNVKLQKLNSKIMQMWEDEMNAKTTADGRLLGIKTKQNAYSEFKSMLNYAVKMDYISKNPLSKIDNFKDAEGIKQEMQYYTAEEFKKFISAARDSAENGRNIVGWDYYVFFNIAFYTGMRKGEIHALKWTDIDGEYISIKRSITQKLKGNDKETPPKNKSSIRTIQMPKPLINVLNEHKERLIANGSFDENFRICGGERPLRDTSIENANKKYAKAAGVKKIRIHDFRHSHASVLANSGINIQEVARRLGH
ncbi:MAG TPA: hypothetical protein DEP65_01220, partial [Ruminococcus sp.]|nr:hypothetical protein [Ruminococcus sp.]